MANSDVKLFPTTLTFGDVVIGTTSPAKDVTLTNDGTTTLDITKIAIAGTDPKDFAQANSCGRSLARGANCVIKVTFKPTASGTRTAVLKISDNAAGSPQTIPLNGFGVRGQRLPKGAQCPPNVLLAARGSYAYQRLLVLFASLQVWAAPRRLKAQLVSARRWPFAGLRS